MSNVFSSSYFWNTRAFRHRLLGLFLCLAACSSGALAQQQASHELTIALPRLLSIRVAGTTLDTPLLLVSMSDETLLATQGLGVRTNGEWMLSASFIPCDNTTRLNLHTAQGTELRLRHYPRVVLMGSATNGWQLLPIESRLEASSLPLCQGQLLYTLTQP